MKPVKKLPSEVSSLVRSGIVIPTPSQALVELVLNSIDAGATSIAVRVDLRIFKIQVVDNGHGISSDDLEEIGNRSVTSKCYTLDEFYSNLMYHGYRGESLASLREMCGLLEIVTRPTDGNDTYKKLFVHGKEEKVKISDLKRPTYGTTVTITDFMFNMPVRRERIKEAVELETMRSCIECISLAHPEISLSIRNDAKGRIIMEKHKSSDLLSAFEHLFGHNLARMLSAVNFSTEKFKISGYIGKEAYRHDDLQFIYVNRQSIMKTKLHKLVAALLSKSSIIRTNGPWKNKPIPKDVPVERWLSFSSLEKQKKFAVFVINITCARNEYEICWDAKKVLIYFKDWEAISVCVSNAIQEFLKLENLVEDDVENEVTEDETRNSTESLQAKEQPSHTSVPQGSTYETSNLQIEFEVDTWNIQGAVHGISAKRPKENEIKLKDVHAETDIQSTGSVNEIKRQFWTPDTINSSKECLESEQESVAPVVKFLRKYETPAAARLQITKGAYRLKQKEEEEKKRRIAMKLGQFKLSTKPKLTSFKSSQHFHKRKLTCESSLIKEKAKDKPFTTSKNMQQKNCRKSYNRVNEPFSVDSLATSSLNTGKQGALLCYSSDLHNKDDINSSQKKGQIFVDPEPSVPLVEDENISNYFSPSLSNDNLRTEVPLANCSESFSYPTEQFSSCEKEGSSEIKSWDNSERSFSLSPDETNVQMNDNFNRSFLKSISSSKNPSHFDKKYRNALSNDIKLFVLKHGSWSSSPFDEKDPHEDENGKKSRVTVSSKKCANLGVSKTLMVSIPTPQHESIPVSTAVSSALMDKQHCSNKFSNTNQAHLTDKYENHTYLTSSSRCFLNLPKPFCLSDGHKSDVIEKLFKHDVNNFFAAGPSWNEQNTLKFIPSSLEDKAVDESPKPTECSSYISDTEISHIPYFSQKKRTTNRLNIDSVDDHAKIVKKDNDFFSKKRMNFRDVFESLEKFMAPNNSTESRSPYFNFKANPVNCKQPIQSFNFGSENICNKNNVNCNVKQNIQENSEGLLSKFGVPKTRQCVRVFPDLDNNNKYTDREVEVCSPVDIFFPESNPVINSESFTRKLEDVTCATSMNLSQPRIPNLQPSIPTNLNELKDNFCDGGDIPKRRRLSQNKSQTITTNKERLFFDKKAEDILTEDNPFHSDCVSSEKKNTDVCGETVSVLSKEKQCQKEAGNSVNKVMDEDWSQVRNFEGKLFYFHAPSGFTTYNEPFIAKDASLYSVSKRCQFLPKGMSPLLAPSTSFIYNSEQQSNTNILEDTSNWIESSIDKDDLKNVKWRNKPDIFNNDISDVLNIALPDKKKLSSNTAIPDLSYISAKMSSLLLQQKFDKRIFANIQVVGQLDNKFIVTLCSLDKYSNPHILGIFDQHAVHERIRLEYLMKAYSSNEDEWSFTTTDLKEPIILTVSSKESHIMSNFQSKFQKLGLHFSLMDKDNIKIHRIPTCLYTRFLRERSGQWLNGILHILIQDVVVFLIKTGGQDLVVPEVFKDVINSEACKGAIKFGDSLSIVQCENLLLELSKCDLPFYCAHGRPSFMPVFDLRQFDEERKKYVQ